MTRYSLLSVPLMVRSTIMLREI